MVNIANFTLSPNTNNASLSLAETWTEVWGDIYSVYIVDFVDFNI